MKFSISPRGAAIGALVALASLTACNPRGSDVRQAVAADPSAVVIGTVPARSTVDPPGTTPVDPDGTKQMSKSTERSAMPLPGQANDHSTLAARPSQHAETKDASAPSAR